MKFSGIKKKKKQISFIRSHTLLRTLQTITAGNNTPVLFGRIRSDKLSVIIL